MIKAVVFVDGALNHYLPISQALEDLQSSATHLLPIDAKYGYSDTQEGIEEALAMSYEVIIITNSLLVFDDYRLKDAVCGEENILMKNYFIFDKNQQLRDINDLTDRELHKAHSLEKLYINKGFEKLKELENVESSRS